MSSIPVVVSFFRLDGRYVDRCTIELEQWEIDHGGRTLALAVASRQSALRGTWAGRHYALLDLSGIERNDVLMRAEEFDGVDVPASQASAAPDWSCFKRDTVTPGAQVTPWNNLLVITGIETREQAAAELSNQGICWNKAVEDRVHSRARMIYGVEPGANTYFIVDGEGQADIAYHCAVFKTLTIHPRPRPWSPVVAGSYRTIHHLLPGPGSRAA